MDWPEFYKNLKIVIGAVNEVIITIPGEFLNESLGIEKSPNVIDQRTPLRYEEEFVTEKDF